MKKIIYIRKAPQGSNDGTANYCKALYAMFCNDLETRANPIVDYPVTPSRVFKYYYRKKTLIDAIKKADIVHINGYTAMGTAQSLYYAHKLGKKVIYTAHWHPFQYLCHPTLGKIFFNMIIKPLVKRCVDKIVTINNEDTAFFQSFHSQVHQIPHWYIPKKTEEIIPKKKNMILFIGRINDPVKNIGILYSLPIGKYEVHCVGTGELQKRPDFIQHVNISNKELTHLYAQASLVVIPSKYEAFSYVALEAMGQDTPVVMSGRVRISDYLHGVKGHSIFNHNDSQDFLDKIENTIGTEVDTKTIKEIFSPDRIKPLYKKLYLK